MDPANIASHLPIMARQQPDALAIIVPHERDPGGSGCARYTYKQLDQESDRIAGGLRRIGIDKGTRTVLMIQPGLDFFALVFALFKVGAVLVAIDPGMGIKNLGKCLAEAGPAAFIGNRSAHLIRWLFRWGHTTLRTHVLVAKGPALGLGKFNINRIRRLGAEHNKTPTTETKPDDVAAILFTSGSTGLPKGVVYTHANFNAQVQALRTEYDIQPGEIDVSTFPLFALYAPALGMTSIIPDMDFTRPGHVVPRNIIEPIRRYEATTMFGSPALLDRVGRWGAKNKIKLPSLRRVLSAGAPVSARSLEQFSSLLGPDVQIFTPYGATECLPVCSIGSDEVLNETRIKTGQGGGICVGHPVEEMQVRIIRISDKPIPAWHDDLLEETNVIGEIVVQGPQVTEKYFNRQEATDLAKIPVADGSFYHRMGDVGYLDDKGRLWFCGRKSQRLRTTDCTLFTIPCEGVFNKHPIVLRSALVGITENTTTRPVLCVELEADSKNADPDQISNELFEIGAAYAHTAVIKDILFHPGFPVDIRHNAKIGREALGIWAAKQLQ